MLEKVLPSGRFKLRETTQVPKFSHRGKRMKGKVKFDKLLAA